FALPAEPASSKISGSEPSLFFAGERKSGSRKRKESGFIERPRFVEDEPQIAMQNSYARTLQQLLYGDTVTRDSIDRRRALKTIGPELERYLQKILKNRDIRIMVVALGSSLKGYANTTSDIEFAMAILDGFQEKLSQEQSKAMFEKGVELLRKQGYL